MRGKIFVLLQALAVPVVFSFTANANQKDLLVTEQSSPHDDLQIYIDGKSAPGGSLLSSGYVTAAGIYDLNGNSWATSSGFAVPVHDIHTVAEKMAANDANALAGKGITVAGVEYMFGSGDSKSVYYYKGSSGVYFCKCKTCILVGYHNDQILGVVCMSTVNTLAERLRGRGI